MDRHVRWNTILELLAQADRLQVEETATALDVSTATIRRDFDELAQQQMLVRTRGGAVANGVAYDLPLRYKTARQAEEKQRIGMAVANLVPARAIVGINGGTTTTEVARALALRADAVDARSGPGITIVTNALNIAQELIVRPNVKLVLTGGVARPQSYELVGPLATPVIEELSFDVTVLGVNAVSVAAGATTQNEGEASVNRLLAARAASVIVAADSSKLGTRAFARICDVGEITTLVTDTGATDTELEPFEAAGVHVLRA